MTFESPKQTVRPAFTVLESALAFALLSIASVVVAQMVVWSLTERARSDARMAAIEWAANVLESARGRGVEALTDEWAASQKLSSDMAWRLIEADVKVAVAPEHDRPGVKRVTVSMNWKNVDGSAARPVFLLGIFAPRESRAEP